MRLWSLHPSLLDAKGLVALWRETLLAQHVLRGRTKGYRAHPQLHRFKKSRDPLKAIAVYLWSVHEEAAARGYAFDAKKIGGKRGRVTMPVTRAQVDFEFEWLKSKLRRRDPARLAVLKKIKRPKPHPMFKIVRGGIEPWERGADA